MNTYEVTKECWIEGSRYLPTQLVKLTPSQAKEWLDRKCIKELKQTTRQARNTSQNIETAGGQSIAGGQTIEDK